jgi:hypothetical protein
MTYGTDFGIVIVDIVQKVCILNMSSPDLYGSADPYQRVPRSPKRDNNSREPDERCHSPSTDQVCVLLKFKVNYEFNIEISIILRTDFIFKRRSVCCHMWRDLIKVSET